MSVFGIGFVWKFLFLDILWLPCGAVAGSVRGGRWFHGTFLSSLSMMDDGRADLSHSDFSVRVQGGRWRDWHVIERKGEKS